MNAKDLHPATIALRKGEIHRLHDARGRRIESLGGSLWVTMDHDRRDIVVGTGEGFDIDREGDTLVSALDDARLVVLEALAPRVH